MTGRSEEDAALWLLQLMETKLAHYPVSPGPGPGSDGTGDNSSSGSDSDSDSSTGTGTGTESDSVHPTIVAYVEWEKTLLRLLMDRLRKYL